MELEKKKQAIQNKIEKGEKGMQDRWNEQQQIWKARFKNMK